MAFVFADLCDPRRHRTEEADRWSLCPVLHCGRDQFFLTIFAGQLQQHFTCLLKVYVSHSAGHVSYGLSETSLINTIGTTLDINCSVILGHFFLFSKLLLSLHMYFIYNI